MAPPQVIIMPIDLQATLRLFQLISPSLPTGAFTYSQGLEWGVESGMIKDKASLREWLASLLYSAYRELEIPLLKRLYQAGLTTDLSDFSRWCDFLSASRETSELRDEERNRGRAMARILGDLDPKITSEWLDVAAQSQVAGFALAAARWNIDLTTAALGYTWSWLENMVMAAVKTMPLGQTAGQQVLADLALLCSEVVEYGLKVEDEEMSGSCPAFAIGSSLHETQFTRLFRS